MNFINDIRHFIRNPLGIIALFITLIYSVASLLLGYSADNLTENERLPLILFLVFFPVLVLGTFFRLVTNHHWKLYSPSDYREDRSFLKAMTPEEREKKLDDDVTETLIQGPSTKETTIQEPLTKDINGKLIATLATSPDSIENIKREIMLIEDKVVKLFENELKMMGMRHYKIGPAGTMFDAVFDTGGKVTAIEIKYLRRPIITISMINQILYQGIEANSYFKAGIKLIIAVVYSFEKNELGTVERMWKKKIALAPMDVELRFIPRDKLL